MASRQITQVSSVSSELYKDFPLPPGSESIRVLEILPASLKAGEGDTSIRVNFKVVDLNARPPFAALSYVWGHSITHRQIYCGGVAINVTENCYAAVLNLRRSLGQFVIWIDAICINQEDEDEKVRQILLMRRIYSGASTVYVWLGEGNERSDRAMAYLARAGLVQSFFRASKPGGCCRFRLWICYAICALFLSIMTHSYHPFPAENADWLLRIVSTLLLRRAENAFTSYNDLNDLFDREWVRRIWTYQELLFASNPVVVCGNIHLLWSRLSWSILFLAYPGINDKQGGPRILNLSSWVKLVVNRSRLRSSNAPSDDDDYPNHSKGPTIEGIEEYLWFLDITIGWYLLIKKLTSIARILGIIGLLVLVILLAADLSAPALPPFLPHLQLKTHRSKIVFFTVWSLAMIFLLLQTFSTGTWISLKVPRLTPEVDQEIPKSNFADAISSRKSTNPLDKSFAVHGVLQDLSESALPVPNYNDSAEKVYKELSLTLANVTNTTHHLLPAAFKSYPGHPSWVADWSCQMPSFWLDRLSVVDEDFNPINESQAAWRWSPLQPDIFTVRGRLLGIVTSVFTFQSTTDIHLENETPAQLTNLQSIVDFAESCSGDLPKFLSYMIYLVRHPEHVGQDLPNMGQLAEWAKFIYYNCRRPAEVLAKLRDRSGEGHKWGKKSAIAYIVEVSRTHLVMCNYLAESRRSLFCCDELDSNRERTGGGEQTSISGFYTRKHRGVCTDAVQNGDKVIYARGVSSMLIVRGNDTVKLVSPAVIARFSEASWTSLYANSAWFACIALSHLNSGRVIPFVLSGRSAEYSIT